MFPYHLPVGAIVETAIGRVNGAYRDKIRPMTTPNFVDRTIWTGDDLDILRGLNQNKNVLFGQQEGRCNGCKSAFEFRHLEVDHIIPQSGGGTDHIENLQLFCAHCNRVKGDRPQEYLIARLREMGMAA